MNRLISLAMILSCVFGLYGCSIYGTTQESTGSHIEASLPTAQADQLSDFATTAPTESTTVPYKTESPTAEPTQIETASSQLIVQPEPSDDDFVMVKTYIPDIFVELRYSTDNNFTNQKIYSFSDAWLRYGTVKKLISVQSELKQSGLYLKLWDCFRPPSAQFMLWDVCPDPTYVSNPDNGFSSHSRGNTVDVTLVYADGTELVMPTGFDDFSELADRDYTDCSEDAASNAMLLEELMKKYGFKPYSDEWWHFSDTQSYPVDNTFEPIEASTYFANCNEYISLRTKPSTASDVITKVLVGERFQIVANHGDFVLIQYNDLWGYVLSQYVQPIG